MKNKKLINWLCLTGILAALFYLLHDIEFRIGDWICFVSAI